MMMKEPRMSNPFEDDAEIYVVLVNAEGQHSLWPSLIAVPAGWDAVHGPADRADCVAYVNANWTDLRPASLVRAMS
jgi:MbtH protein